jgi:hypothetical protein
MSAEQLLINRFQQLDEQQKLEILDFAEYLFFKKEKSWNKYSMINAIRGMEDDIFPDYMKTENTHVN